MLYRNLYKIAQPDERYFSYRHCFIYFSPTSSGDIYLELGKLHESSLISLRLCLYHAVCPNSGNCFSSQHPNMEGAQKSPSNRADKSTLGSVFIWMLLTTAFAMFPELAKAQYERIIKIQLVTF